MGIIFALTAPVNAFAQLYWDTNGNTAGASSGTTANGTWSASATNWTGRSAGANGGNPVGGWTNGSDAVFSAGTNATGTSTITTTGTTTTAPLVDNLTVEEGNIIISGNLRLTTTNSDGGSRIDVGTGHTLTFQSGTVVGGNNTTDVILQGGGNVVFAGTTSFANSTIQVDGVNLSMTGTVTIDTLNITSNSVIDFSGTLNLTVTNLNISTGVVLTINNYAGADTFNATTLKVGGTTVTSGSTTSAISFNGFSGSTTYNSGGSISPPAVPEPATYGALFMASALGGYFWVRRRKA